MGLGAIAASNPWFLGMLGMHGTYESNMAMYQCDVMLAVGARFDDRVTGDLANFSPPTQKLSRLISTRHQSVKTSGLKSLLSVIAVEVLVQMNVQLKARLDDIDRLAVDAWWDTVNQWKSLDSLGFDNSDDVIKPQFVVQKLFEATNGDAFITSDVGQHQMWAAQYYAFEKPRRWINSGGLGTMGFGLPAALGVQLAYPDDVVACITGDASIQMCLQELSTCLAIQSADQGHQPEQSIYGDGSPMAGIFSMIAAIRIPIWMRYRTL